MILLAQALLGAAVVVLVSVISRTRSYYVAGLVPLFPTFALISHWIVGSQRTVRDLRATVLFGMLGVVPYLAYLGAVYVLAARMRLAAALVASLGVWLVVAGALVAVWGRR